MFDVTGKSVRPVAEQKTELEPWWQQMLTQARARRAEASRTRPLGMNELEALARQVYEAVRDEAAVRDGVRLPEGWQARLVGELSGLGALLDLIADPSVEDVALNLHHLWVYRTGKGWSAAGRAPEGFGNGLRVLLDQHGVKPPTPDRPIVDAMIQVLVPDAWGASVRKGLRVNYIMAPASPYGDTITIRVATYSRKADLGRFTAGRLPPEPRPPFVPPDLPRGAGALSVEAASYLLSVLAHGGVLVVAGPTGSGKTTLARDLLQAMLDCYPRGALRLFVIEDANEIVLNGWDGDPYTDTGNVVYTVTRPAIPGGPEAITAYDLIRAALRSRPHGIILGEARGAEAWELARAAATGHGHAVFTIHATSVEGVWPRFVQAVQSHPDVRNLPDWAVAQAFAEAVTAVVAIERHPRHGQHVREIAEVGAVVERSAARPSFNPLFRWSEQGLIPTGNQPIRPQFRAAELALPDGFFRRS